jgi:hypothetical protein
MNLVVAQEKPNISLLYVNEFFFTLFNEINMSVSIHSSFSRHLIQYIFDDAAKNLEAQGEGVVDSKAHRDHDFDLA